MNNSGNSLWNRRFSEGFLWNRAFSHVYIEEAVMGHPVTQKILSVLAGPSILPIRHYKNVFCRKNQEFAVQRNTPQLILAKKTEPFFYAGSPLCDNFGHADFHYTSDAMNCLYQCDYCYLQGMYPSANLVVFVNIEDTFRNLEKRLEKTPMYICVSYDADLLGLEPLLGFAADWIGFAACHPDADIELRTKSANFPLIAHLKPPKNLILAWSLSPERIADSFEKGAPSLGTRLRSMSQAIDKGWRVRLCVDPMIRIDQWESVYDEFFQTVRRAIPVERLVDCSVGVFRVPKDSLKVLRAIRPKSPLLAYPFVLSEAGWSYPEIQTREMIRFMTERFESVRHGDSNE